MSHTEIPPSSNPLPKLLRVEEVAKYLKISRGQAYNLVQRGDLPAVRIRRSVRVREDDLRTYVNNNLDEATQ